LDFSHSILQFQHLFHYSRHHFATNGLVDDITGFGVPGALALAPSGEDNGWLTSAEIMNLPLQTDLVVLSGCDTAGGIITSDGIIGLSRSFLTAGASSVIGSLWNISDNATIFLMIDFYQELSKNTDKAEALRQAMLITMKKYPNPMNWAAFTLIGESE